MISYVALERISELEIKLDETVEEMNKLVKENEKYRDALEEILEQAKDEYDVDPDPTGGHHDVPNRWMRIGTMIEEVLGRLT